MQRRILLPLDGSPTAEAAIPHTLRLAEEMTAHLFLLQVVPPARVHRIRLDEAARLTEQLTTYLASEYLLRLAAEITAHHPLLVRVATRVGEPARQIVEFAHEQRVSLIVMTVASRRSFWQNLRQPLSEQVACRTRLPLLLVQPETPPVRQSSPCAPPPPSAA